MMNRIGLCLNTTLDLDGALVMIAEYLVETTQAESGAIFVLNTAGKALRARALAGPFPPILRPSGDGSLRDIRECRIAVGEGIIGFVAKTGEALLIADALSDARVTQPPEGHPPLRSLLAVPLQLQHKTLGVCVLLNRRGTRPFDDQDLRLTRQLAGQAALTVNVARLYEQEGEQRRLGHELRMAHEFQKMLLPRECPLVEGLQIATYGAPALELGGDYYDFLWVEKPLFLGVTIADVSGKGIPGALVMAILRSALRGAAPGTLSPRDVLRQINRCLLVDTQPGVFVTMTYALIDVRRKRMRFVRAGHEPLIVWNEAEPEPRVLQPGGLALGLVGEEIGSVLEECEVALRPGDTVVFYTDGVVEALNAAGAEYGPARFHECLGRMRHATPDEQIRALLEDIRSFTGGIPQNDDTTLVVLKIPAASPTLQALQAGGAA
jgi:sigma-B regulation protein RsbU (phosphoserine phosphatase)